MSEQRLINVQGCFRCKRLVGELRAAGQTKIVQGYEQCSLCRGDINPFWINLTEMKFQESRSVSLESMERSALEMWNAGLDS